MCFVSTFSQKCHLKWSILTTKNSSECVPLDGTVNPILKFKPKLKLNPDWIHHTNFEIGDLSFIFFLNFSFYSCTHFLQSIISPNCDCQKSPKSIRGLDALLISPFWWLMTISIWAQKRIKFKKKMKGRSPISKWVWWIRLGFNFNFQFEFEYRIHRTIKGDAFAWIFGW